MVTQIAATVLAVAGWIAGADAVPADGPPRVGRIVIVGNVRTTEAVILKELAIYPGQVLPVERERLLAEIQLLMKFHKRFDLDGGNRPRIEVQPPVDGGAFRDVRVSFPERPRRNARPNRGGDK